MTSDSPADKRETTKLPMICVCNDEGRAEADALLAEVYARLGRPGPDSGPVEVSAENFLSRVSWSLWWNLDPGVSIEGIYSDQWFGVKADNYRSTDPVFVPCDRVEDGIAAIWKYYADKAQLGLEHGEV